MVDEDEDLDLDVKPKSGKTKTIIIVVLSALLLIGVSVGTTLFFLGGDKSAPEEAAKEPTVAKAEEKDKDVPKKPIYLPLETMVVNFADPKPARYLQVDIQLMAYDPAVLQAVEENMPVVRNDILVLLGGQSYDAINSREGKEALRGQIVTAVNRILNVQAGIKGKLQAVYFTSFVMQ
jgi:flagellar FliL protein